MGSEGRLRNLALSQFKVTCSLSQNANLLMTYGFERLILRIAYTVIIIIIILTKQTVAYWLWENI